MLPQSLHLRREREQPSIPVIVKRLDAQPVARAKQPPLASVPQRKREHAAESFYTRRAILLESVENRFRVGPAVITMSGLLQLRPQIGVIEDLSVVCQKQLAGFLRHRLLASRQIHDAQAAMPQEGVCVGVESVRVRSAMADLAGHPRQDRVRPFAWLNRYESGDAAHRRCFLYCRIRRLLLGPVSLDKSQPSVAPPRRA